MLTPEYQKKSRRLMDQTADKSDQPAPVLKKHPWEMDKSLVEIILSFDSKVVADIGDSYAIEMFDPEGNCIEADLEKYKFDILPHEVEEGTHFWLVEYKIKNREPEVSVWPVAKYWHESWRESKDE
jgi:hypothetical protein